MNRTLKSIAAILTVFTLSLPLIQESWSQSRLQKLREMRDQIKSQTNGGEAIDNLRKSILSGIAFYPDEVIAAIFTVAQEPDTLANGGGSSNPEYNQAMELLAVHPEIVQKLSAHPNAARILGEMAEKDLEHTWELIDGIREQYREESGVSVAEAVVSDGTPPVVAIDSSNTTYHEGDQVVVDMTTTGYVYVEDASDPEVVYVYPSTAVPYPVATSGYYYTGNAAVSAGGVVVTEDGDIYAGKRGAAVVETQNGTVAVGGAGHAHVDTEDGEFSTDATVGAINENGDGVVAHRESDGSWDANSYDRSVDGHVQATNGQGFQYEKDQSGQLTEDGFTRERSGSIETNDGRSAEYESSSQITQGDDGLEVDRGGSATGSSGETVEWGNQGAEAGKTAAADSKTPSQTAKSSQKEKTAASSLRDTAPSSQALSGFQRPSPKNVAGARSFKKPSAETWDHFSSQLGNSSKSKGGSKYRRTGSVANSREAFSGKSLSSQQLGAAVDRGLKQQQTAMKTLEPRSGGFQGPNHTDRPQTTGFQGSKSSKKTAYSGVKRNSTGGIQSRGGSFGGGRGGRR